jgi:hypothetical protein
MRMSAVVGWAEAPVVEPDAAVPTPGARAAVSS